MGNTQLFIPEKIRVGFQTRNDTYTQQLAYVIYYDKSGKLRKESSWESWRDKTIDPVDYDNYSIEGFVLNKGVGGVKRSYGWNPRNEYIRVYDPRGFEFEISVANLLFILRECDCSKGKRLEGEFVYAWDGTSLVLLPTKSEEFKKSSTFTDLQGKSVKVTDLIEGATYITHSQSLMTYLGRFDYHFVMVDERNYGYRKKDKSGVCKKYVFYTTEPLYRGQEDSKPRFVFLEDLRSLAQAQSETVIENYAELVDRYYKSINGSCVVELFLKQANNPQLWYTKYNDEFVEFSTCYKWWTTKEIDYIIKHGVIQNMVNFVKWCGHDVFGAVGYPPGCTNQYYNSTKIDWVVPTNQVLYAKLASGSTYKFSQLSKGGR